MVHKLASGSHAYGPFTDTWATQLLQNITKNYDCIKSLENLTCNLCKKKSVTIVSDQD